jgi:hypothetical protein
MRPRVGQTARGPYGFERDGARVREAGSEAEASESAYAGCGAG